jgi:hypothetical protein
VVTSGQTRLCRERARKSAGAADEADRGGDVKMEGKTDTDACAPLALAERTDVPRMEWERAVWPQRDAKYARYGKAMSENAERSGRPRRVRPRLLTDP